MKKIMKKHVIKNIKHNKSGIFNTAFSGCLALYSSIIVFLISITVLNSFKNKGELVQNIIGFPKRLSLDNYYQVIVKDHFFNYFLNSIIVTLMSVTVLLIVSSLTAYGLFRYDFKGKQLLTVFFLLGLMFPLQLGILPNFILLRTLHLVNNFIGMCLLYTANLSFAVFVFSKFFQTLPNSLYESAKIDGAGELNIFIKIMFPLSKPVIASIGLIKFVEIWNDFYLPLVFLTKPSVRTMSLGIYRYMTDFIANWHLVFTAVTIALVPIILIFIFSSKQLIEGLTSGALKE